jgi:hypothetical protein
MPVIDRPRRPFSVAGTYSVAAVVEMPARSSSGTYLVATRIMITPLAGTENLAGSIF